MPPPLVFGNVENQHRNPEHVSCSFEQDLIAHGMPVESADRDTVIPIIALAAEDQHVMTFLDVLITSIERHRTTPRKPAAAVGRVSAELIAPYPPGGRCWHQPS